MQDPTTQQSCCLNPTYFIGIHENVTDRRTSIYQPHLTTSFEIFIGLNQLFALTLPDLRIYLQVNAVDRANGYIGKCS